MIVSWQLKQKAEYITTGIMEMLWLLVGPGCAASRRDGVVASPQALKHFFLYYEV